MPSKSVITMAIMLLKEKHEPNECIPLFLHCDHFANDFPLCGKVDFLLCRVGHGKLRRKTNHFLVLITIIKRFQNNVSQMFDDVTQSVYSITCITVSHGFAEIDNDSFYSKRSQNDQKILDTHGISFKYIIWEAFIPHLFL